MKTEVVIKELFYYGAFFTSILYLLSHYAN